MNIDFCLSEALKYNMEGIKQVLLSYDLMCQFWKNLEKRFQGNPHLMFPGGGNSPSYRLIPCSWPCRSLLRSVCTDLHPRSGHGRR